LPFEVAAAAGSFLVFQDHPGGADALQILHDVAGDHRVDIAVVDVDEQMLAGKRQAQPLDEVHHVWPGDEPDIRQAVMGGGEPESGDK